MPELPEVTVITEQLNKRLKGLVLNSIEYDWLKKFSWGRRPGGAYGPEGKYSIKDLKGAKVVGVRRLGKVVVIDLTKDKGLKTKAKKSVSHSSLDISRVSILIHLKLTGQLIYQGPNLLKAKSLSPKVSGGLGGKHTHVIFYLDHKGVLYYNDVRKFGWIKIIKSSELKIKSDFIARLGPEPVVDKKNPPDNPLTLEKFKEIVSSTKRVIKVLLMDQEKIGGIGNIYANDALWLASILPTRSAKSLSPKEQSKLYDAILNVLKEGLKRGGASELSYVTPDGNEGSYQEHFLAYGKKDEPCDRCHKGKFEKITLGGRGTYFCPFCQKG